MDLVDWLGLKRHPPQSHPSVAPLQVVPAVFGIAGKTPWKMAFEPWNGAVAGNAFCPDAIDVQIQSRLGCIVVRILLSE
jgi:hypothetical protein